MASAEREPTVYNGGLVAEPTGPTPLPLPLYQFQERPLEKVGWTCPPHVHPSPPRSDATVPELIPVLGSQPSCR